MTARACKSAVRRWLPIALAAVCTSVGACAWTQTLDEGVAALERSRGSVDANTVAASESSRRIAELRASVEDLQALQSSVARTASLLERLDHLQHLDDLEHQLAAVARLAPALARVGDLDAALDRVAGLAPALEALAPLDRLLGEGVQADLGALKQMVPALSQVRDAMNDLVALRAELRAVAGLQESMANLGRLVEPMDRLSATSRWLEPPVLAVFGVLWGALTITATALGTAIGHRLGNIRSARAEKPDRTA